MRTAGRAAEWSQRTSLITVALVPHRSRVLTAKLAASVLLSIVALALCLALAVVGTAVAGSGVENAWSLPAGLPTLIGRWRITRNEVA